MGCDGSPVSRRAGLALPATRHRQGKPCPTGDRDGIVLKSTHANEGQALPMNGPRTPRLFLRLAVQGLGHRPSRAALLAAAVAVGGASIFAATILGRAIRDGTATSL